MRARKRRVLPSSSPSKRPASPFSISLVRPRIDERAYPFDKKCIMTLVVSRQTPQLSRPSFVPSVSELISSPSSFLISFRGLPRLDYVMFVVSLLVRISSAGLKKEVERTSSPRSLRPRPNAFCLLVLCRSTLTSQIPRNVHRLSYRNDDGSPTSLPIAFKDVLPLRSFPFLRPSLLPEPDGSSPNPPDEDDS